MIEVGNRVIPVDGSDSLRSGGGSYSYAIVACLAPFRLVSARGDMLWSTLKADQFMVTGDATPEEIKAVALRCSGENFHSPLIDKLRIPAQDLKKYPILDVLDSIQNGDLLEIAMGLSVVGEAKEGSVADSMGKLGEGLQEYVKQRVKQNLK